MTDILKPVNENQEAANFIYMILKFSLLGQTYKPGSVKLEVAGQAKLVLPNSV